MIAVAVHQIAVLLFKQDGGLHKGERTESWIPPVQSMMGHPLATIGPFPTMFFLADYSEINSYPDGEADVADYWAENRILGGIIMFCRGQSNPQV
jgi:hypothetical protein